MSKMTQISGRNRFNGKVMSLLLNVLSWRYLGDIHLKRSGKQLDTSFWSPQNNFNSRYECEQQVHTVSS